MEFMSQDVFDSNNEQIRIAVQLLLAKPESRKKFQLAAVYEKSSGDLLAEVLPTALGPVVVYATSTMGNSLNQMMIGPRQIRSGRRIDPLLSDPRVGQVFWAASRSAAMYPITRADLIRIITEEVDPATFRFSGDDAGALTL